MNQPISATAGTLESSDAMVTIVSAEGDREIELNSVVINQYGDRIRQVVNETLDAFHLDHVYVKVVDKGALDFAIRARVETAAKRYLEVVK